MKCRHGFLIVLLTWLSVSLSHAVVRSSETSYDRATNQLHWVGRNGNNQDYSFAYDNYGNVTHDGIHSYEYLDDGTMVSLDEGNPYSYDANNHRVEKDGQTYVYDAGQQLIGSYDSLTGNRNKEYVYLGSQTVARLGDATLPITYFHNDITGTAVAATDALGATLWQEERRAYGAINTAVSTNRDKHLFTLGYTGHQEDANSNLVYAKARYYNPEIGRFYAPDPISFRLSDLTSINRYVYAANNPYKYVDPNGEQNIQMHPPQMVDDSGQALSIYETPRLPPEIEVLMAKEASKYLFRELGFNYEACSSVSVGCGVEVVTSLPALKGAKIFKATDDAADASKTAVKQVDEVANGLAGLSKSQAKTALQSAQEAYKGTTRVGHALSKHAGRNPDIWRKVTGSQKTWNDQAMKHMREIFRGPGEFSRVTNDKGITFLEKRLSDGRGARLNQDYTFKGFID